MALYSFMFPLPQSILLFKNQVHCSFESNSIFSVWKICMTFGHFDNCIVSFLAKKYNNILVSFLFINLCQNFLYFWKQVVSFNVSPMHIIRLSPFMKKIRVMHFEKQIEWSCQSTPCVMFPISNVSWTNK